MAPYIRQDKYFSIIFTFNIFLIITEKVLKNIAKIVNQNFVNSVIGKF